MYSMSILNIHQEHTRKVVFKKKYFLLTSVFFHLIVMYVIAQSVMFPHVLDTPPKKPNIIQARLVFEPPSPAMPIKVIKKEIPLSAKPKEEPSIVDTTTKIPIEPIPEPEVKPLPSKYEKVIPEKLDQNNEVNEIKITQQPITSALNLDVVAPTTSMAKRHLNSFQLQQRNKVATQASRYYQQHKNSPVIEHQVKNPFMTEDEKIRETFKLRADCSSSSKKTTAVILGFLGGQIDCSKPPSISGFIQDRINKQSRLPEQYQQQDNTRPQSVVIKKQP
jgi:hypothetical protein